MAMDPQGPQDAPRHLEEAAEGSNGSNGSNVEVDVLMVSSQDEMLFDDWAVDVSSQSNGCRYGPKCQLQVV